MSAIFTHLVPASIEQARAAGAVDGSEDARLLQHFEALLVTLRETRGREREGIARRLHACQAELVAHLERSGRGLLAEAMLARALDGEPIEP